MIDKEDKSEPWPEISRRPAISRQRKRTRPRTERPITRRAEARIRKLIENPPPGSAIDEAKKAGVDLHRLVENLKLTPAERFHRAIEELERRRTRGQRAGENR